MSDRFTRILGDHRGSNRGADKLPTRAEVELLFGDHDGSGLSDEQLDGLCCVLCGRGGGIKWPVGYGPRGQLFVHVECCAPEEQGSGRH